MPARAWHSHASEYGWTEGRKGRKEGWRKRRAKQRKRANVGGREGVMEGRGGWRGSAAQCVFV